MMDTPEQALRRRVRKQVWVHLADLGTTTTVAEIQEAGAHSGIDVEDVELTIGHDYGNDVLELGYWRQLSEREILIEMAQLRASIEGQNAEYRRLGLL